MGAAQASVSEVMGLIPDMDTTCGTGLEGILGWCLNVHEWLLQILIVFSAISV